MAVQINKMTAAQFREYVQADKNKTTASKYKAKPVNGYASRKEAKRAGELKLLQGLGAISNLQEQVPFLLIPPQRDDCGNLIERGVTYVADFVYKDRNGKIIVEDTKGVRTKEYILKRKLMLKEHGIRITEI